MSEVVLEWKVSLLKGCVAELREENEELRADNARLRAEVADMTGIKKDWESRCFDDNGFHH